MKVVIIMLLVATVAPALGADIYQCVEANGNLRFTNTSPRGCKRLNLPPIPAANRAQPTEAKIIQADTLNLSTYALVDPDESVRERAQQAFEQTLSGH